MFQGPKEKRYWASSGEGIGEFQRMTTGVKRPYIASREPGTAMTFRTPSFDERIRFADANGCQF
jgi:hypothetical protein